MPKHFMMQVILLFALQRGKLRHGKWNDLRKANHLLQVHPPPSADTSFWNDM